MADLLEARGITVRFDGVTALDAVDLALAPGEIVGMIGPNGAGKTTLVNVLSGFQRPTAGTVALLGADATTWSPDALARAGVARTFQAVRAFPALTALENVEAAAVSAARSRRGARALARELLDRMGLAGWADRPASALPHADERRLGIARALALRPRFLLLDEPAAGMGEAEGDELVAALVALRDRDGIGLLVVEHDVRLVMALCERIQVLDHGRTLAVGTPAEIRADAAVRTAYLGAATGDARGS